ncbi:MAG TPA: Zn-dependent alcohol dehydrogenase [Bacillales bacterium]|nr:Zn-dependent alcohol dehydrogenase [Bacillales bacterium]
MRAAVLHNYGERLKVEEVELESPKIGEVRVQIKAAGICHSDLHVMNADLPLPLPMVLGHEGAGVVDAVGEGVTRVKPGDHVVLNWVPECGECFYCRSGRPDMCEEALKLSASGTMADGTTRFQVDGKRVHQFNQTGTFAEYTVVPESGAVPVREDVPFELACLVGCGVMTGVGAVTNTAKVKPGSTVAVIGTGGVGLNVIQGAALSGAKQIISVDLLDEKLEMTRTFGATDTVNAGNQDVIQAVLDLTGGLGVDYAFEVIGRPQTMAQAYNITNKTGTAVIVGIAPPHESVSVNAFSLPSQGKTLTGSWYGQANASIDIPRLIDLYAAEKIKLDPLISKFYALDQINEGFEELKTGKNARGVIRF